MADSAQHNMAVLGVKGVKGIVGLGGGHGGKNKQAFNRTGQASVVMGTIGLLMANETDVKNKVWELFQGTEDVTINSVEESGEPKRWFEKVDPDAELAKYDDLSAELKNKIHEYVLASLPHKTYEMNWLGRFYGHEIAWARVNKENYSAVIPMFYKAVKVDFHVRDFNFRPISNFLKGTSIAARHALLHNPNLRIHLRFTDDTVERFMISSLYAWLALCQTVNQSVQLKPFSGVRIPWTYRAYAEDEFAHLDAEVYVFRWGRMSTEVEAEWEVIKAELHEAPQRF